MTDDRLSRITAGANYPGGDVLINLPNYTDLMASPEEAVKLGETIICAALDSVDGQQLRELAVGSLVSESFVDDYRAALHACPRCGDGPYPKTKYPEGDGWIHMPEKKMPEADR